MCIPSVYVLDLAKAFDTVNRGILLGKLYSYGICGVPYEWYTNYLIIDTNMPL